MQLLRDVPQLESAGGVVVRMPAAWRASRPSRPRVTATVGGKAPSGLGAGALLDFRMEVTLDGETLTAAEIKNLLAGSELFGLDMAQSTAGSAGPPGPAAARVKPAKTRSKARRTKQPVKTTASMINGSDSGDRLRHKGGPGRRKPFDSKSRLVR